jgi:hypothetical protein
MSTNKINVRSETRRIYQMINRGSTVVGIIVLFLYYEFHARGLVTDIFVRDFVDGVLTVPATVSQLWAVFL